MYAETIFACCVRDPATGCREWQGPLGHNGYGLTHHGPKHSNRVHRVIYDECCGPIPVGLNVLHTCDNRKCCEPTHLFVGSQQDNMQDCVRKGRTVKAKKLTREQVRWLKEQYAQGANLSATAREIGVPRSTIEHAVKDHVLTYQSKGVAHAIGQ